MSIEPAAGERFAVRREGQALHADLKAPRQHSWQGRAVMEGIPGPCGGETWPFICTTGMIVKMLLVNSGLWMQSSPFQC